MRARIWLFWDRIGTYDPFQAVEQVCEELGAPIKPRYVREQLAKDGGKFKGIGRHKHGRIWLLTDDDVQAIIDRMRVPAVEPEAPAANPSGISPRSRRFKNRG